MFKMNVQNSFHFSDYIPQQNINEKRVQMEEECDLSASYFVQTTAFDL